jgi:hypothetical protein
MKEELPSHALGLGFNPFRIEKGVKVFTYR